MEKSNSGSCLDCEARGACAFVALPQPSRDAFEGIFQARTYFPGGTVARQGDPVKGLFVVQAGMVRLLHLTPPGKSIVVHLAGPAEILGLSEMIAGKPYPWDIEAVERSVLEHAPRERFIPFLEDNPGVALELLGQLSQELVRLQTDLCTMMSGSPLRDRLLEKLKELCEEWGVETDRGLRLDLRLTVQDLADQLGSSRQWVSKSLGELEREGLIRRQARSLLLTSAALAR